MQNYPDLKQTISNMVEKEEDHEKSVKKDNFFVEESQLNGKASEDMGETENKDKDKKDEKEKKEETPVVPFMQLVSIKQLTERKAKSSYFSPLL